MTYTEAKTQEAIAIAKQLGAHAGAYSLAGRMYVVVHGASNRAFTVQDACKLAAGKDASPSTKLDVAVSFFVRTGKLLHDTIGRPVLKPLHVEALSYARKVK